MNYIVTMNEKIINKIVSINESLNDINFHNNTLTYENSSISLENFELIKLFENYNKFPEILPYLTIEEFLSIIKTNTSGKKQLQNKHSLRNNFINKKENIKEYNQLIEDLIKYEDYIDEELTILIKEYQELITEENNYQETLDNGIKLNEEFKKSIKKRLDIINKPQSGGYINSLLIVTSICVIGISLATVIFLR